MSTPNNPSLWSTVWSAITHRHPTHPTDGRDTVWRPYEALAPTGTVQSYLDAWKLHGATGANMPDDWAAYLKQRVPSMKYMHEMDPSTKIDDSGKFGG